MQVDKEKLIKHHFWILLGVSVPLVLIAYLILAFSVSGKVKAEQDKVENMKKSLDGITNPKNGDHLAQYQKRSEKVSAKQDVVWGTAFNTQRDLMTYPREMQVVQDEKGKRFRLAEAQYGEPINANDLADYAQNQDTGYVTQIREVYEMPQPYNEVSEPLVQYRGTWNNVIRVVVNRGEAWKVLPPTNEEFWLAQEDLWVQRELLRIIRECNNTFATFKEVTDPNPAEAPKAEPQADEKKADDKKPDEKKADDAAEKPAPKPVIKTDPKHRKFANAHWEVDLQLVRNAKGESVLRGTIKNKTKVKRLVDFYLRVQVQEGSALRAYILVSGEPVAAGVTLPIRESAAIDSLSPQGIFGVEQMLNWRTAPVKRVDELAMGYHGHRQHTRPLVPAKFIRDAIQKAQAEAAESNENAGGTAGPPGVGQPTMAGGGGPPSQGGTGGNRNTMMTPNGLIRNRYIDTNDQVRRMPVGMVVVVDQANVQDFLAAFANARLRIQTTQFHLQHFRENIRPAESSSDGGTGPAGPGSPPMGSGGSKFGGSAGRGLPSMPGDDGGADDRHRMSGGRPSAGRPTAPSMGGSGMGGMGQSKGMGMGMPGMRPPGLGGYPGMPSIGGSGGPTYSSDEDQEEEMNLVELAVYGIASLYERFPPKKPEPEPDPAATPATPAAPPAAPAPAK